MHYQLSYWEYDAFFRDLDFLVVGAGIVGLNAALRLREKNPKARIVVLERGPLPIGASTRNAGFACFGSMTELLDDLATLGEEQVWALVRRRYEGLQRLRARVGDRALHYQQRGGYELFRAGEEEVYSRCLDHLQKFNRELAALTGEAQTFAVRDDQLETFRFGGVQHLIWNKAEGQVHTGHMMRHLLRLTQQADIQILGGIPVQKLADGEVRTAQGWSISARRILVATNGFARQLLPELAVEPARNQVLVTEPVAQLPFQGTFHYDRGYVYFRNIGQRVLLGGARHLAKAEETTSEFGLTETIQDTLLELLHQVILPGRSEVSIAARWSGILGVGTTKEPILHQVNDSTLAAVRLGGMGVAIGSLLGEEAADVLMAC